MANTTVNQQFCTFRFGTVMAIMTKRLIKKDEELFVDYKYDTMKPKWYEYLEDVYYRQSLLKEK